jgi:hypothetical protein
LKVVHASVHSVASGGDRRRPLGERLVEPEVVPPLHGHEVAEPHVRQFVQDRDDAALLDGVGHLAAEDVRLGERHGPGVLHRAGVELGDEELVVLGERVGDAELLLVVREPLTRLVEDVLGVEVLPEALAAVDTERDDGARGAGQLAEGRLVRAGDDRGDVGRDPRGGLERPDRGATIAGHRLGRGELEITFQAAGAVTVKRNVAFRSGCSNTANATGVGNLELRVEVDLAVDRVDEAVQALAGVGVQAVGVDDQLVLGAQTLQGDAGVGEGGHLHGVTVQGDLADVAGDQVDERRRPSVAPKRTTVREPNTSGPRVRSSAMSYDCVSTMARRSCASMRVRFSPGTAVLPWVRGGV